MIGIAQVTPVYEQLGFACTGRIEPYPNDASLVELEMLRRLPVHG